MELHNQKSKISIILPVYGVEKYIEKCIISILKQKYTNFECIIINDGTTDNSIELAQKIICDDNRFFIYHKENGGLSSARNYGLSKAQGDYILFIDSDDFVEDDLLLLALNKTVLEDADICLFGINYVDEDYNFLFEKHDDLKSYLSNNDFLLSKESIMQFVCTKLYKKSIFDDIKFCESMHSFEDVQLNFQVLFNKKIVQVEKPLYNYVQREGSLSKSFSDKYLKDRLKIACTHWDFCRQENLINKHLNYIRYTYLKTFIYYSSIHIARFSPDYKTDIKKLFNIIDYKKFSRLSLLHTLFRDPKVGFSLIILFSSSTLFKKLVNFYFSFKQR